MYVYQNKEYNTLAEVYKDIKSSIGAFPMPSSFEGWEALGVSKYDPYATLESAKQTKKKEIETTFNKVRNSSHIYVQSSLGFPANANETAIINVMGLINKLQVSGQEKTTFRAYDNQFYELTLDNLKKLQAEIADEGTAFYLLKWQYEQSLEQATSIEEVKALTITFPNTIAL